MTGTPFVVTTIAESEFTFAGQLVRCEALKGLFGWRQWWMSGGGLGLEIFGISFDKEI